MSSLRDNKSRPATYVDNNHEHALRSGLSFLFDMEQNDIAPAGVVTVRFLTGDNAIVFEVGELGYDQEKVLFEVFEDTVYSAPGSLITTLIQRNNRMSSIETQIQTFTGPTISDIGTIVRHTIARGVAGQGQNKPGFGGASDTASFVLKPNTEHAFRVTNQSELAVDIEAHLFYHEVDPRQYA